MCLCVCVCVGSVIMIKTVACALDERRLSEGYTERYGGVRQILQR